MRPEILALDLIMLIMYCSVFWLTGKIVGKGDAGRVISKLVSTATMAAGLVLTGGASGASNIANASSAGKNVITDNKKE